MRYEYTFVNLYSSNETAKMSLRWIHENLEPPTVDEECSDIDDSCSDDSYATDFSLQEDDNVRTENGKGIIRDGRKKRETKRPPTTTVTFDGYNASGLIIKKCVKMRTVPKRIC